MIHFAIMISVFANIMLYIVSKNRTYKLFICMSILSMIGPESFER